MNFEPADRLPIMYNWLTASYVQSRLGMSAEEYWADQLVAYAKVFKVIGVDFFEQWAFPAREDSEQGWAAGELERWSEAEAVAADLEKQIAALQRDLASAPTRREAHVQEICDYQIATQRHLGEDCVWIFGPDSAHGPDAPYFPYGTYGYEGFFLTVAMYPDVMERFWQATAELNRWHNECVVEVARRRPETLAALADIRGLNPRSLGDGGSGLLEAVSTGCAVAEADLPRVDRKPRTIVDIEGVVELMGALVRVRASEHSRAVPLLATRSDLERLASGERTESPLLAGWRRSIVGDDLVRLVEGALTLRVADGKIVVQATDAE